METQLLLIVIAKSLVELAGMFLLGQGVLYVLAGAKRESNGFYQLFQLLTRPLMRATRALTPRAVLDKHVPLVAVILLAWVWVLLVVLKAQVCASGSLRCIPQEPAAYEMPVSERIRSA